MNVPANLIREAPLETSSEVDRRNEPAPFARVWRYVSLLALLCGATAILFAAIHFQLTLDPNIPATSVWNTLQPLYGALSLLFAFAIWPFVRAEEKIRAAQQELERQAATLRSEIVAHRDTDAALQRAKDAAEAASIAKSRYIRGMSHELRTPLNAIIGYGQLLEKDASIPDHRKVAIRVVRRSGEHLSGLVDGLLDISMIEAGRLTLHCDEVNLKDFLASIVDMFKLQAEEKGLAFAFTVSSRMPDWVHTDEKRLRQILINLLSNAIRYTDTGSVALHVNYRNQVARIDVEDTGIGIAPEDCTRIFAPFERAGAHGQPHRPGTGLGLTLAKAFAEALGGDLSLISTPGQGSRFTLRMMLSSTTHKPRDHAADQRRITGYCGPRVGVLVVDDDAHHAALMRDLLEPLGFDVRVASDGAGALAQISDRAPALVLLDVSLPDLSGWDVARALDETLDRRPPIIMVSAGPREAPSQTFDADCHDAYLMKPLNFGRLLETLATVLRLEWIYDRAPVAPEPVGSAPGPEAVQRLLHLTRLGHLRGLTTELDRLEADLGHTPAIAHLKALAERVEMTDLERALRDLADVDG